jgi:hypothetical protein
MTPRRKTPRPRPVIRTRTQEQSAADARRYAANLRVAGRLAFRYFMLAGHGCTGKGCASPGHAGDLKDGLLPVLQAMEVIPDPDGGARGKAYHWGEAKGAGK